LIYVCSHTVTGDSYGPAVRNLLALYNILASSVSASGPHSRLLKGQVVLSVCHTQVSPLATSECDVLLAQQKTVQLVLCK